MVILNHIKHKPVRGNASPLIKKMGKHTNLKKNEDEDDEGVVDCDTQGALTSMAPFFLALTELAETLPPADFLPPG